MRRKIYKAAVCLGMAGMAFGRSPAVYGAWQPSGSKWQYTLEDGRRIRSSWYQEGQDWYRFDQEGFMVTGWYLSPDGRWYFLNPVSDGTKGKMMTGWQWIDGYCYYLNEQETKERPLGAMYAGEKTPDGYVVDEKGAWTDDQGVPVHIPGKGIEGGENAGSGENKSSGGKSQTVRSGSWGGSIKSPGKSSGAGGSGTREEEGDPTESGVREENRDSTGSKAREEERGSTESGVREENRGPAGSGSLAGDEVRAPSGSKKVNWQVYFTDLSTHQVHLMPSRNGVIEDGSDLTIYFPTRFTDGQGFIWQSRQQSPYVVSVEGPQNNIIYVEYEQAGKTEEEKDPWPEERQRLEEYLDLAREAEAVFLGKDPEEIPDFALTAENALQCDLRIRSAASRLEPGEEGIFYVIGKDCIPEGSILAETYGDEVEYSNTTEGEVVLDGSRYTVARFWVSRKEAEQAGDTVWTGSEKRHWRIGDIQERTLDGISYRFRCIDENYRDETDPNRQKALFLCESVIPADTGSEYIYQKKEDGTYDYEFCPGPIVSFGDTDSYKHSRIRSWLGELAEDMEGLGEVSTGVSCAYEGSTAVGSQEQLESADLTPRHLGSQNMKDRLFILSVDEALKYRKWLWRFEGAGEENPESQCGAFCKSYWLRTPGRKENGEDTVYVVDLLQGNIHPQPITIQENPDDIELGMTGTTGLRPAFAAEQ